MKKRRDIQFCRNQNTHRNYETHIPSSSTTLNLDTYIGSVNSNLHRFGLRGVERAGGKRESWAVRRWRGTTEGGLSHLPRNPSKPANTALSQSLDQARCCENELNEADNS